MINVLGCHNELMYREAVQRSELQRPSEDLFDQLDKFGQQKHERELELKEILIVAGSVMLVERYGFIKGDEFNGRTPDGARTYYQTVSSEAKRKRP